MLKTKFNKFQKLGILVIIICLSLPILLTVIPKNMEANAWGGAGDRYDEVKENRDYNSTHIVITKKAVEFLKGLFSVKGT